MSAAGALAGDEVTTPTGSRLRQAQAPATVGARWRSLALGWRILWIVVAGVVIWQFAASLTAGLYQPPPSTAQGAGSSTDATPLGGEAMSILLAQRGHPVTQLFSPIAHSSLPSKGTLFVIDPQPSFSSALPSLRAYLRSGGTLVLAGAIGTGELAAMTGSPAVPAWTAAPPSEATPTGHSAFTAGVSHLAESEGSWDTHASPSFATLLEGRFGPFAVESGVGTGTLVLVASPEPLANASLALAGDAAFAIDLAGKPGSPVEFDEYDHGLGRSGTGLAGLPLHWRVGIGIAILAGMVWLLSAVRRFGPPQRAERPMIPARLAHVDALATALAGGGGARITEAAAPLADAARVRLGRLLHAPPGATDQQLVHLAAVANLPSVTPELARRVLTPPATPEDAIAAGEALARIQRFGGRQQ